MLNKNILLADCLEFLFFLLISLFVKIVFFFLNILVLIHVLYIRTFLIRKYIEFNIYETIFIGGGNTDVSKYSNTNLYLYSLKTALALSCNAL